MATNRNPTTEIEEMGIQKQQRSILAHEKKPKLDMKDCPSPDVEFGSWLKHQKQNWRSIRRELKSEKKVFGTRGVIGANALTDFIRNMDDTVLNSIWHVLSVESTYEAGILRVWALTEQGSMFSVKMQVGRKLYINSKVVH